MSAANSDNDFRQSTQDLVDVFRHDNAWKNVVEVESGGDDLAIVSDQVNALQLHNPAQLAQEFESTREFIERTRAEVHAIEYAVPSQGSESAIDALESKLMRMINTPGVLSAMERIGAIQGYREVLNECENLKQMLKIAENSFQNVQELVKTSQHVSVSSESPRAQSLEEHDRVTKLDGLVDFFLDGRKGIDMNELGTAVQDISQAVLERRFERANLATMNVWLSWDSKNTLVPIQEKNSFPCEYQDVLTLVYKDTKLIKYSNLHQTIETLYDHSMGEDMLQKVACTLKQVLLKICRTTTEEQPNLVCLRLIELLAYCLDMSKTSQRDHCLNLFKTLKAKLSHQIRGDILLRGLTTFVETQADGTANQYETIGYCLRTEARNLSSKFPSLPNDQRFLIVDNERVIIVPRVATSIKVAQVEEVELFDDREKV